MESVPWRVMGTIFKVNGQWVVEHAGKQERIGKKHAMFLLELREAGIDKPLHELLEIILNASLCVASTPPTPTVRECIEKHIEFLTLNKQNRTGRRSATSFKPFLTLH